jgi:homoserine kinase
MMVRVPASSANLGPGFDALGLALSLHAEIGLEDDGVPLPARARSIDRHHPASVAFHRAGGVGSLWERCPIPSGRGLGFSGAVRVGGAVLAHALRFPSDPQDWMRHRADVLALVTELEGHADNAAASLYGGAVAVAGGRVVSIPLGVDPAVVVWIPSFVTSTDESRLSLGVPVSFEDAVFNVGRTALLVAALAAGDVDALRTACQDRLHQDRRLAKALPSGAALGAALDAGAWAAWLSGSGPTIAMLCAPGDADELAQALPGDGHTKVLRVDHQGATIEAA